jgi:hypothetical protein
MEGEFRDQVQGAALFLLLLFIFSDDRCKHQRWA